jgi:ABC-type multidrug transport system fused ATPase/permease subunit
LRRLSRQLSTRRRIQFLLVLLLMLTGAAAELLTLGAVLPFLALISEPGKSLRYVEVEKFLGSLGLDGPTEMLLCLTALFSVAAIAAAVVRAFLAWAINRYVFVLGHELGVKAYSRILYQPYSFHVSRNTSTLIAATTKVQAITSGVFLPLLHSISSLVIGSVIVAALFFVDPMISLVAFGGFGAIYLGVSLVMRSRLRTNSRILSLLQSDRIRSVQEGLGGIRDILISNTQPVFIEDYRQCDADLRRAQASNALIGVIPRFFIEATGMVLIAFLALLLTLRERDLAAVLPMLGALALGAHRLLPLMQVIYNGWTQMLGNLGYVEDVLEILEMPVPPHGIGPKAELSFTRAINFRDVWFSYPGTATPVLRQLNLTIPKGGRIGIVGETGAGKSTLVDLLMGLLEPTAGQIEVDGRALDMLTSRAWQRRIAHVPQAVFLSEASIAENIAFGVEPAKIDLQRVRRAARQAALASFVESLPDGYETRVGERGVRLSGGQRQRVGVARALYKDATILVFDEATNALDTMTEAAVLYAIRELDRSLTVIMIAHRPSTVAGCDRIVTIAGGQATEEAAKPFVSLAGSRP